MDRKVDAVVAELVDAPAWRAGFSDEECGFESYRPHHKPRAGNLTATGQTRVKLYVIPEYIDILGRGKQMGR